MLNSKSIDLHQVLGIMGALDPHVHKRNQLSLPGSHGEVTRAASDSGQHIQSVDELPMELWPSFATSEDYFSTVLGSMKYSTYIHNSKSLLRCQLNIGFN